ncbi:hypothetical protein, partial [Massilia genomosp. 1]|uniref:hypothetical protein n=1 Tax=Massilia genomosp. 1 TaxID=2609280 RepID=UPI001C9E468D
TLIALACLASHNLNYSNRPVRTRMPGGVAGEQLYLAAPYADVWTCCAADCARLFLAQAPRSSNTAVLTRSETVSSPFEAGVIDAMCCKKFREAKPDNKAVASANAAATNSRIKRRIASFIRGELFSFKVPAAHRDVQCSCGPTFFPGPAVISPWKWYQRRLYSGTIPFHSQARRLIRTTQPTAMHALGGVTYVRLGPDLTLNTAQGWERK